MSYFLLPKTNNDINININIQLSRKKEIQITSNCVLQYYERMCNEIIKIKTENSFEPFNDYENIVENIHPYQCIYKNMFLQMIYYKYKFFLLGLFSLF